MGFMKEFSDFLKEQKIISVALAFIVGLATAALITALVNDIIGPTYQPYLFTDPNATSITVGKSTFKVGDFINSAINWIVILLIVFIIGTRVAKTK